MSNCKGILVFGETANGELASVALEMLGAGRKLAAARGEQVAMVIIDKNAEACAKEAVSFGADNVFTVSDAPTEHYEGASYADIMEKICTETMRPAILLIGHTLIGRDLAPRLACKLKTGLVMDCVDIEAAPDTKNLIVKKPVSGGNVLATCQIKESGVQMATIRRKAADSLKKDESRQGHIVNTPCGVDASSVKAKLISRVIEETEGPNIENADIVVTGGRGVGSAEAFETHIKALAKVLGAGVGATRAAVDGGMISEQHQVGLTGKIVGPGLYIAVALSGAIQHMAGCSGSKNIVAINKDENAQIFKFARFGVVGDFKKILPALTEKLKETL